MDEDLPRGLAAFLRDAGLDVIDVRDAGLRGSLDDEVLSHAVEAGAALVTADVGFANILRFPPGQHRGIVPSASNTG